MSLPMNMSDSGLLTAGSLMLVVRNTFIWSPDDVGIRYAISSGEFVIFLRADKHRLVDMTRANSYVVVLTSSGYVGLISAVDICEVVLSPKRVEQNAI